MTDSDEEIYISQLKFEESQWHEDAATKKSDKSKAIPYNITINFTLS